MGLTPLRRGLAVFIIMVLCFGFLPIGIQTVFAAPTVTTVVSTGAAGSVSLSGLALGSDGFGRIAHQDDSSGDLLYTVCGDSACTAGNATTTNVDATGYNGLAPSLAIASDGFARIAYQNDADFSHFELKFAQCTNSTCSSKTLTVIDSTGTTGNGPQMVLGSDGFARISYKDGSNNLHFVQCTNASCSTRNNTSVTGAGSFSFFDSVALGSDGFGRIAFYDQSSSNIKYVKCGNAACSSGNTINTIASPGSSTDLHLRLATDDTARIAFVDRADNNLKYAVCANASCSSGNVTISTVTSVLSLAGGYLSMVLGSDGNGRISFQLGSPDFDLAYVKCGNTNCTSGAATVSVVDNDAANVGGPNSLALGSDGFARIAYWDATNDDLKFGLCDNDTCGAAAPTPFSLTGRKDTLSRERIGVVSNHTVEFSTVNGVASGKTITITFPSGFDLSTIVFGDIDVAYDTGGSPTELTLGSSASGSTWGATVSGQVLTIASGTGTIPGNSHVVIEIGTNATAGGTGTHQIVNPSSVGSYPIDIGGTFPDSGSLAVPITETDLVTPTGNTAATLTFDIDTSVTDSDTPAPNTVPLGVVTPTNAKVSGSTDNVNFIWIDFDTNASGGGIVSVRNTNGSNGLVSTSVPGDTIASNDGAISNGTARYGLCVVNTSASSGTFSKAAPYNTGTCAGNSETNDVQGLTSIGEHIVSSSAPLTAGRAQIAVNASISSLTPAHPDYSDALTFIATGTF